MLEILRESKGGAVTVDDEEMIRDDTRSRLQPKAFSSRRKARPVSPPCRSFWRAGKIAPDERVVIFNTGSGIKYLECFGG